MAANLLFELRRDPSNGLATAAADEIERLQAENERLQTGWELATKAVDENESLRAALKPFADYADPRVVVPFDFVITQGSELAKRQLTMGDCYEARRVLGEMRGVL